jgi:hypothetical protein
MTAVKSDAGECGVPKNRHDPRRQRAGRPRSQAKIPVFGLFVLLVMLAVSTSATPLQSLCEKLSAKCQTCGKSAAERTAIATAAPRDPAVERPVDDWGRPVRVSVNNGQLRLQSAGPDGTFDSADDVVEQCPMH